jgi:hypothetical protein
VIENNVRAAPSGGLPHWCLVSGADRAISTYLMANALRDRHSTQQTAATAKLSPTQPRRAVFDRTATAAALNLMVSRI